MKNNIYVYCRIHGLYGSSLHHTHSLSLACCGQADIIIFNGESESEECKHGQAM